MLLGVVSHSKFGFSGRCETVLEAQLAIAIWYVSDTFR